MLFKSLITKHLSVGGKWCIWVQNNLECFNEEGNEGGIGSPETAMLQRVLVQWYASKGTIEFSSHMCCNFNSTDVGFYYVHPPK